eukprot:2666016-Pyramimonas_sp.AAC.1
MLDSFARGEDHMELNSRKIMRLFKGDVEQMARDGTATPALYYLGQVMSVGLLSDVQQNESWNSCIQSVANRNPHIGLPLLSARVAMSHVLGLSCDPNATSSERLMPMPPSYTHNRPTDSPGLILQSRIFLASAPFV